MYVWREQGAKGTQFLRDHFGWELVEAREEAKTLWSIEHELALTEFEVACWEFVQGRADLDVLFTERRYMHERKSEKVVVVPDAGFLLRQQRSDRSQPGYLLYFVEHDQGTEKVPAIRSGATEGDVSVAVCDAARFGWRG